MQGMTRNWPAGYYPRNACYSSILQFLAEVNTDVLFAFL